MRGFGSPVITEQCECAQAPESAANPFYRMILQMTKNAARVARPPTRKTVAIAHDRQPLDRAQKKLQLPSQSRAGAVRERPPPALPTPAKRARRIVLPRAQPSRRLARKTARTGASTERTAAWQLHLRMVASSVIDGASPTGGQPRAKVSQTCAREPVAYGEEILSPAFAVRFVMRSRATETNVIAITSDSQQWEKPFQFNYLHTLALQLLGFRIE